MRCVAIVCGLCLMLSTAAASGTPFRGSSIAHSALNQARAINATLLGNRAVEATVGKNSAGTAEAFAFRARRGGTAVSISVYLGARDRATRLFAGLYSSRRSHPESLLTAGLLRSPKAGRWNRVAVGSVLVRSGGTYWLAVLSKVGTIYFRDRNRRSCTGERSSRRRSRSLARTWAAGRNSRACLISAYVSGVVRTSSAPPPRTPPPIPGQSFCNIPAAYTNLTTGPHLCGWPDSTDTGYQHASGYAGRLTVASPGSPTCPTTPQSNHTYSFCRYVGGLSMPPNLTSVTFYGDEFESNAVNNANVRAGGGDNSITFDYDTFQPEIASPPVSCSESYQYGIYNEGGAMGGYTVEHGDFWGFGNAIDTEGSTQANPQVFKYNWIHDSSTTGGCGYHNDGIGMLNGGTEDYAVVDHNTIEFTGNTNLIAWQNGTYSHDQNTNNLLSGDNEGYAGGRCMSSCTAPSYIETTGNTFNTYLAIEGDYPIDNATAYWSGTGSTWSHNYWAVPPGAAWGTSAYNGYFWVPTTNSNYPEDCGFVSATDYPNARNPCR